MRRKNKKLNRALLICGTTLMCVQSQFSQERRMRRVRRKRIFEEIMVKNFQHLMKTINTHTKEAQEITSTRNIKKTIPRFIKIKLLRTSDKEKILKAARKKDTLQRNKDNDRFLTGNNANEKTVGNIFKTQKEKFKPISKHIFQKQRQNKAISDI